MKTTIDVNNISKKFKVQGKPFYALKNVNLRVQRGEIFALMGPNGSGKTTLLNIMTGMLIPDAGHVDILGKDVQKNRSIIEDMNFVSPEMRFHWTLSIRDVLNFYGMAYGIPRSQRERKTNRLLNFFGIEYLANRRFDSLSTGERMRLVFSKSLLNEPKILLLDEPTLGLDPKMALTLRKEILKINKQFKTTIFLTSHYMKDVERLSQRLAFIYKGKIIKTAKTKNVKKIEDLEHYFINTLKAAEKGL